MLFFFQKEAKKCQTHEKAKIAAFCKKCNYSRSENTNGYRNHYIPEDHNRKQYTEPVSAL